MGSHSISPRYSSEDPWAGFDEEGLDHSTLSSSSTFLQHVVSPDSYACRPRHAPTLHDATVFHEEEEDSLLQDVLRPVPIFRHCPLPLSSPTPPTHSRNMFPGAQRPAVEVLAEWEDSSRDIHGASLEQALAGVIEEQGGSARQDRQQPFSAAAAGAVAASARASSSPLSTGGGRGKRGREVKPPRFDFSKQQDREEYIRLFREEVLGSAR